MLKHKGTRTIETDRLILRRAVMEDAMPMFRNWASDPEVTKYLTWPPHEGVEVTRSLLAGWIKEYERDDYYHWMIVLKELGEPIGSLLVTTVGRAQSAHVGYCIGKIWWRKGIMPEALRAVMAYLFDEVGYHRIESMHDPNNPNSGRVMRKCGMKYEGTTRASDRNNQGVCDADHYAILRSDWGKPRHFMEGYQSESDTALVQEIYRRKPEEGRIESTNAGRVEFLTTVRYIEKYLTPGERILDVGAGTGAYSLYFARKGYRVSALELADTNIAAFRAKLNGEETIDLVQGNALDLSRYESASFDVVLLFGPLYHLHSEEDQLQCITEAKRVCKPDGKIFFAFISNDMVILTMQQLHSDYLLSGDYDKETFQLEDFPFVFHTVSHCRQLLEKSGVQICHEVASDGASELLKDLVNSMDEATYRQYLRYHFYICEKPEFLGMSNHLLFVGDPALP